MLTSKTKFFILVLINIIALVLGALYLTGNLGTQKEAFETEFVLDLIDKEKQANETIDDLTAQLEQVKAEIEQVNEDKQSLQASIEQNSNQLLACETQKTQVQQSINTAPPKQVVSNNCDEVAADLALAKADLSIIEQQNKTLQSQLQRLTEQLKSTEQNLSASQALTQQKQATIDQLNARIKVLENYLSSPIMLDQHYLGARYCTKPKFESLICVVEFLARPSFSKLPVNELEITIRDSKEIIVAQGVFESAQKQMYRLTLGRGKEVTSGDFIVEYKIDNQTLFSEAVSLIQE